MLRNSRVAGCSKQFMPNIILNMDDYVMPAMLKSVITLVEKCYKISIKTKYLAT